MTNAGPYVTMRRPANDSGEPANHAKRFLPMATVRRTRRKTEKVLTSASVVRLRGRRASAGKDAVRSFAAGVAQELGAKHAAGRPYSTLNAQGDVVFVHPDGTVRTGRAADSPAVA
jgi:hypothetical protein